MRLFGGERPAEPPLRARELLRVELLEWWRARFEDAEGDCVGRLWEKLVAEAEQDSKAADGGDEDEDEEQVEGLKTGAGAAGAGAGAGAAGTMAHALELMGVAVAAVAWHALGAPVAVAFGAT